VRKGYNEKVDEQSIDGRRALDALKSGNEPTRIKEPNFPGRVVGQVQHGTQPNQHNECPGILRKWQECFFKGANPLGAGAAEYGDLAFVAEGFPTRPLS
jgi:hypothetical protein